MIKFFQVFGGIEIGCGMAGFFVYYSLTQSLLFSLLILLTGVISGMIFLAFHQILEDLQSLKALLEPKAPTR